MNSEIVLDELNRLNAFSGKLNRHVMYMADSLDKEVPKSMRLNIANYSLSSFVSHFHTKVVIEDSFIPTNFVGFTLAKSGASKTSSVNRLERALGAGYDIIETLRKDKQEARAKEVAEANDDENWLKYVKPLNPLFNSISTEAGMIKKLNDFHTEGIGLPSLFVDEVGTELASNPDMVHNIKLVSELFDSGNKKTRALKDETMQSEEVNGMGMCAMFIGSDHNILLDESVLHKFNSEFVTKLARRCFFNFPEFNYKEKEATSIDDILAGDIEQKEFQLANAVEIKDMAVSIANNLSNNDINNVMIDVDAERLYKIYKFHCKYESEKHKDEAVLLEQLHRHWKVLKLAGVYAVADERTSINSSDIVEAISFAEMLNGELSKFIELSKRQDYEILIDLLKIEDNLTIHELKKKEIIRGNGSAENKVNALIELANSKLGKEGMLRFKEGVVSFEAFIKAEHGASYKLVSGTKEERAYKVHDGFEYKKSDFSNLSKLLCNDTSYLAFELRNGKRSNDNVISGATFAVLDIDDSDETWTEVHDLLQDYTHHVALTSDPNNPYKFRVLIELDIEVKLESRLWKNFMAKIGEHLGLEIDLLAQSQQYYGFKDRVVMSSVGDSLEASELIKTIDTLPKEVKKLAPNKIDAAYKDRFNLFNYAYEVSGDTGASAMYRAFKHAKDLGMGKEEVILLMKDICEYRDTNFDYIMKRTGMMNQIQRSYHV